MKINLEFSDKKPRPGGSPGAVGTWIYTGYIYDAGGNTMAIYNFEREGTEQVLTLKEQNIYGAGRLGLLNRDKEVARYDVPTQNLTLAEHNDTSRTLGHKIYEFGGHTGNVHVTTTDRTIAVDDGTGEIYTYLPDVNSTASFYSFGLQQPGRNNGMDSYRYAFQGMEYDAEKTGTEGGSYTTEFRQYDPRLGRWLSLDPLMEMFPNMSPYCAYDNNPIYYTDPYGLEATNETGDDESGDEWKYKDGEDAIKLREFEFKADPGIKGNLTKDYSDEEQMIHNAIMSGQTPLHSWFITTASFPQYGDVDVAGAYQNLRAMSNHYRKVYNSGNANTIALSNIMNRITKGVGGHLEEHQEWVAMVTLSAQLNAEIEMYTQIFCEAAALEILTGGTASYFVYAKILYRLGKINQLITQIRALKVPVYVGEKIRKLALIKVSVSIAKGGLRFTKSAAEAANRLGFDPGDVSISDGVADVPIIFTSEVRLSDISTVSQTLKSAGATSIRVNTGPIINTSIVSRIESAYTSGKTFMGFIVSKTGDPNNMYILVKGL